VNHTFAGHPVDQRNGLLEGALRPRQVVAVDGSPNASQRVAQSSTELAVLLAVL